MNDLLTRIQRDLRPFADPGTTIEWSTSDKSLAAEWESRGNRLAAQFFMRPRDDISVSFDGRAMPYSQFLAHPMLGDVFGLAKMIYQASKKNLYITTRATDDQGHTDSALSIINGLLGAGEDKTEISVIFVTGDAGAGKTSVLNELVRNQADRYIRGEVSKLYFYVNAQGRALARLDEALAVTLQDLRAVLTYDALPVLVRNRLIVPVVDGFDELLGVTGYDDAFASLRRFIDDVEVEGQIVAAARSTYYEQEFLRRATAVPQPWELIPVRVEEWDEQEFAAFLEARYAAVPVQKISKSEFSHTVHTYFDDPIARGLRGKPFFVARAAELALEGNRNLSGGLIEQLASQYIERDRTEKLVQVGGAPILTRDQIEELFTFVAEEMWLQETRELDLVSIRDVAEIVLSEIAIAASAKERVIQRAPTSAFFRGGRTTNRVEFEHEALLSYFLSRAATSVILRDADITRSFLSKGNLPPYCAQFSVDRLYARRTNAERIIETLNAVSGTSIPRANRVKENSGAIVACVMNHWVSTASAEQSAVRIADVVFAGETLRGGDTPPLLFEGIEFRRVDFSNATLLNARATNCLFYEVLIDLASTRLEIEGIDVAQSVSGLRVRDDGVVRTIYAARDIANSLRRVGANIKLEEQYERISIDPDAVALIEKIMQAFSRANVIWPEDSRHAKLTRDPYWLEIRKLLLQYEIAEMEPRQHKGTSRESLRRKYDPNEVMAGVNPEGAVAPGISEFWRNMRLKFPA